MSDNMIYNINPLIISKIRWRRFRRIGMHPSKQKYLKRKNPIRAFLGIYEGGLFDGCYQPTVEICGSDGTIVACIACISNDHAERLCNDLTVKLNEFLCSLKERK